MDATPRFDTGGNHMGAWWGLDPYTTNSRDYSWTLVHPIDDGLMQENLKLKQTVDELHKRNHELIENQSKIEQKARIQQRQYDAKVYAYWKQKAETLASKIFILENEIKKTEGLQEIVSKLMDKLLNRSRKLIAIKRILDGNTN